MDDIASLLAEHLHEPTSSWSVGEFGLLAEFHHAGAPGSAPDAHTILAEGGALRVEPAERMRAQGVRPLAYETPSPNPRLWNHGIAFCVPVAQALMGGRTRVTELGPDREAIFPAAREHLLFDLGLGRRSVDFCVRTADPALIALLRAAGGASAFEQAQVIAALVAAGPARVVLSRLARVEVTNPIPAAGGVSPAGPHTHLLPVLMKRGRTHNASIPVPEGFLPCLTLYPANPARDAEGYERPFDARLHTAFQALLQRFGDADYVEGKRASAPGRAARSRAENLGRLIAARQRAIAH